MVNTGGTDRATVAWTRALEAFGVEPERARVGDAAAQARRPMAQRLERLWRGDPNRAMPTRVARAVGMGTAVVIGLYPRSALHLQSGPLGWLIGGGFAVTVILVPDWALERWYRARRRREQELLLPPELEADTDRRP